MKVIIDGQVFENPTHLRIEVAPEGETVGPWTVEIVGGVLTVRGNESAFKVDVESQIRFIGGDD